MAEPQSPIAGFEVMQQFAQGLMQIIAYAQKDMNVQRAAQGQTLAPGSSFGPPPIPPAPQVPPADQPVPQDAPIARDETWAEHYGVRQRSNDEMAKLRQRNVQEAARRQAAMIAKRDTASLEGPDPFTATPPAATLQDEPATSLTSSPQPDQQAVIQGAIDAERRRNPKLKGDFIGNIVKDVDSQLTPVRTPQPPTSTDEWGNWQNTQVDYGKTTGTDNTQPDATQLGVDLRNQLDRNARVTEHLFKLLTDAIIKINQRLEQVEAGFEPRECT